jgi:hypothetical protein
MTASSLSYQTIFDSALTAYEKKTGKSLPSDPLYRKLESCHSPDAVLDVLREQIPGFDESGNKENWLTKWLDPIVNLLCKFSPTIGGAVGLVSLRDLM